VTLAGIAAGVAVAAAALPPRLRLLGLLPIAQGAAVGWLALKWNAAGSVPTDSAAPQAHPATPPVSRTGPGAVACAGLASVVATTLIGWQVWKVQVRSEPRRDGAAVLAAQILSADPQPDPDDPESSAALEAFRASVQSSMNADPAEVTRLRDWLDHRATAVSRRSGTGLWIWGGELLLATAAAGWCVRGTRPGDGTDPAAV